MRVTCPHCRQKAVISSSNKLSDTVTDLYCNCKNTCDCGATFVFSLSYNHTINPPVETTLQIVLALVNRMTEAEKVALGQTVFR
ncbi:MAG: ogr/Delta-like zinc finger family protein [Methylococcaceae bacterium]